MPAYKAPGLPWQPGEAHRAGVKLEVEEKNAGTEAVDLHFPETPHKPLVKRPRRAHRPRHRERRKRDRVAPQGVGARAPVAVGTDDDPPVACELDRVPVGNWLRRSSASPASTT